jgi:transaldolase
MRKLFLDTANLADIEKYLKTSAVKGVTTNPSLMAKEPQAAKVDLSSGFKVYLKRLHEIKKLIKDSHRSDIHLSVEVITLDPSQMVLQAQEFQKELEGGVDLFVKIPVLSETLDVITELRDDVQINATGCMTALQAKLAADAGAQIVSFFYNRMIDGGVNPQKEIENFCSLTTGVSDIICGSIRTQEDVLKCWQYGADIVTASPKIITEMITHPKTTEAITKFQKDIEAWLS